MEGEPPQGLASAETKASWVAGNALHSKMRRNRGFGELEGVEDEDGRARKTKKMEGDSVS